MGKKITITGLEHEVTIDPEKDIIKIGSKTQSRYDWWDMREIKYDDPAKTRTEKWILKSILELAHATHYQAKKSKSKFDVGQWARFRNERGPRVKIIQVGTADCLRHLVEWPGGGETWEREECLTLCAPPPTGIT